MKLVTRGGQRNDPYQSEHHLVDNCESVWVDGPQADVSCRALIQADVVERVRVHRVRVTRQQVCNIKWSAA